MIFNADREMIKSLQSATDIKDHPQVLPSPCLADKRTDEVENMGHIVRDLFSFLNNFTLSADRSVRFPERGLPLQLFSRISCCNRL